MARKANSSSPILWLIVLVFLGIVGWNVAPMFLPMYRWLNVDMNAIATKHSIPIEQLDKPVTLTFRYNPRGDLDEDPAPWQLLIYSRVTRRLTGSSMQEGDKIDEWQTLVRAVVLSDRTGRRSRWFFTQVGGTAIDRYFEATGVRLPPGSLGQVDGRAVFLYDGGTLEKQKVGIAKGLESELRNR